jgi:hypothetical protein
MIIKVVPPSTAHLRHIASHMNPLDVQEVLASRGLDPLSALLESVEASYSSRVAVVNGEAQVAFGIALWDDAGDIGIPWMLSTGEVAAWRRQFLRGSRIVLDQWKKEHKVLVNFTDARHTDSHRWLKWLGFEFVELHEQFGAEKAPFWRFQLNV